MSQDSRPSRRTRGRAARAAAAAVLSVGLLGTVASCGFDAQLLKPYTPSDGTNIDVGEDGALKVRNLVLISRAEGEGILSATLVSTEEDRLTGVTVAPQKLDGTVGAAVPATLAAPVDLAGSLIVLTDKQPLITMSSPELEAGGSATVVMTFDQAGEVTLNAPVVDGTTEPWSTISPAPASASPTP